MKIAVDMDNTIFDDFGRAIRPGMLTLLGKLKDDGHELVLWTSSSRPRALQILAWHDCARYFSALYCREDYDPENRGAIKDLRRIGADAIIDDDPKHCQAATDCGRIGILVASFRGGEDAWVDDLDAVYQRLCRQRNWFVRLWKRLARF